MNKIINKIFPVAVLAFVLALSSCLNDSDYDNNLTGTNNKGGQDFVAVQLTSAENSNSVTRSYDNSTSPFTVEKLIPIILTSGPAKSDVKVTFKVYTLADTLTSPVFKSKIAKGMKVPDPTKLMILNTGNEVLIKAGESTGYIRVKFTPSDFLGKSSIFAIKITSVSDSKYVISNLSEGFVNFGIKNQYHAMYICNGYRIRPGNPTELVVNEERELKTINATTVQDPKFGSYATYHVNIDVTTQIMSVGGVVCYKVIATPVNDAGDVVGGMYTTFTGDAASKPTIPAIPTEINYYNPITKTFVLNCYYTSTVNRIMYEVLVRQ